MKRFLITLPILIICALNAYAETVEVIYRWQAPLTEIDQIVFQRLQKTLEKKWCYYYYVLYARCKDDIMLSCTPDKVYQTWIPESVLLDGKEISYQEYDHLIETGPSDKYRIIHYQQTPEGLLKLGEQPAGSGRAYLPDVTFVPKTASAIGEATPTALWQTGLVLAPLVAAIKYFQDQAQEEAREKKKERLLMPPIASFTIIPFTGTLSDTFYADASNSYDPHELPGALQARWDWENDGVWDTPFSINRIAAHAYPTTGTYTVTLEVIDGFEQSAIATRSIMVIDTGPSLDTSAPHPMFRHNPRHTALSSHFGPVTNTLKWKYLVSGKVLSSPAIAADGAIYVGAYDANLYAINPNNTEKWTYATGGSIYASPALAADGTVYVGSGDGKLYAINSNTGILRWVYDTGRWIMSSPAIAPDGTVYVGNIQGQVYAINYNGTLKWTFSTGDWIESSPALAPDGTIYIGSWDKKLYALNPYGTLKWVYLTTGRISSSPAIGADGTIYVGSLDKYLYAVNPDGSLKWKYLTGGEVWSSPALGPDGTIYVGSDDHYLYALNPADGSPKWAYDATETGAAENSIRSSPAIDATTPEPRIYFGSDNGRVYAITSTATSAQPIWKYNTGSPVKSSPAITGTNTTQILYIGSMSPTNYCVYAIGADSGDPAALMLQKKANKQQVNVGDIITYAITINNTGTDPAQTVQVIDRIPGGFKYVPGSAWLNNTTQLNDPVIDAPVNKKGRNTLTFALPFNATHPLAAGANTVLSYQLVVGSGVSFGRYENQAYAQYRDGSNPAPAAWKVSNTARETVEVVPDPLFDLGTIIGKVFEDQNGNGLQDEGEAGLPGVRLALEDGTIVTTDQDGKYHIPGISPGTHLLKVDTATLPLNPQSAIPNPQSECTTDNPRVVRITPGLLAKVNFGLTPETELKGEGSQSTIGNPQSAISNNAFFLVALGEGELGYNRDRGNLEPIKHDDRRADGSWSEGRLAYYLKAQSGEYTITSSLDTDRTKPYAQRSGLFRYIDPDKYYPIYGDNSRIDFDATNTEGPLYLLVERAKSSLLWGNYQTALDGPELANYHRTLYGARFHYEGGGLVFIPRNATSNQATENTNLAPRAIGTPESPAPRPAHLVPAAGLPGLQGRPATLTLFGAEAHQLSSHNEFRATGGSLYYLKHQDLVEGSEKVRLETRDKVTGLVLGAKPQVRDTDYEIDYGQGRIIFQRPLASVQEAQTIISQHLLDGNPVYVVVDYEYEPDRYHFERGSYGGRAQQEINDYLTLGGTYVKEQKDNLSYELQGADSRLRLGRLGHIALECAQSNRGVVNSYLSTDGGLSFNTFSPSPREKDRAYGVKAESTELVPDLRLKAYYQDIQPEFSSYQAINQAGTEKYGSEVAAQLTPHLETLLRYDVQALARQANRAAQAWIGAAKTQTSLLQTNYHQDKLGLTGEYRHQEVTRELKDLRTETNDEADLVAGRASYQVSSRVNLFLEQQATLCGQTNHQTTAGGTLKLLNSCTLKLQGTTGTLGQAGLIGLDTQFSGQTQVYSSFSQTRTESRAPSTVAAVGTATQLTPATRLYSQEEYRKQHQGVSFGQILGIKTAWLEKTSLEMSAERSLIYNLDATETRRMAGAIGVNYLDEDKLDAGTKLELRLDESVQDKKQYLFSNHSRYQLNPDLSLLGRVNYAWTENDSLNRTEARFREYGTGLAYRPVRFDRLNLLAKYTYLEDLTPIGDPYQSDPAGITHEKSHIYALEGGYDLNRYFQLVEKMAEKVKREKVGPRDFTRSETYLWINRLNFHVIRQWDIGVEYRTLRQKLADDRKQGFLVEVTRELHQHIQLGVGYNFTDFDDDLTARNDYSVRGPFIRLIGKF